MIGMIHKLKPEKIAPASIPPKIKIPIKYNQRLSVIFVLLN